MTFPNLERIGSIFNYCDRWCERCAFTTRCGLFAIEVATGMCGGDHTAGMALAASPPPPMTPEEERQREALIDAMNACEPTDAEVEAYARQEAVRQERLEETPAVTASIQAALLMKAWLSSHEEIEGGLSARAADALAIARWDRHLIPVKLLRALRGRDEHVNGESVWDDPIQNDWNGTAKLTLLCIRRSIHAWDVLAEELRDPDAKAAADQLRGLQREVEMAFPSAERFVRPGFDY